MLAKIKNHKLLLVFTLVYFCFSLLTYKNYGITSDEEVNYRAGKVYLNYLFSTPSERRDVEKTVSPKDNPKDYPAFRLYPGIISLFNPGSSYQVAHLLNLFFGYFGFLAIYLLVFEITQSKLSVFAPILLFLNPYYFGHIPANPKDVPFATLYLLCVYLILRLRRAKIIDFVILGACLGLLVGIRLVGATLFVVLIAKVLVDIRDSRQIPKRMLFLAGTFIASAIILYIAWPYLWDNPFGKMLTLIKNAESFAFWDRKILFDGVLITKDQRPWFYLFTYLLYKTPVMIILGAIGSIFVKSRKVWFILGILVANLLLYLVIQPTIYNEMRHFMYLVPLLTAIASVFFVEAVNHKAKIVSRGFTLVLVLGILKLSYDFILLHPYQYVYFNELVGKMSDIPKKYEVDYWSASYKEDSEYLRTLSSRYTTPLRVYPCNLDFGVKYYAQGDFLVVDRREDADYIICDNLNAIKKDLDLESKIVYRVVRKGATLSYVAKTAK